MSEIREMPYECDCSHTAKFEEEVHVIRSITTTTTAIIMNMYPPRICEKCGDVMRRVMEE